MFVARALDPQLRAQLARRLDFQELPFVRGRTVVPESGNDLVIAGHPNHLGVFDLPDRPWIAVTGRWSALREAAGAVAAIETEPVADLETGEAGLEAAGALAKHLGQLRGVTVPFPPQCPVLIVLLPIDPATIGLSPAGYPELPGGARIEVAEELDAAQYAADIGRQLEDHWKPPPQR